MNDLNTKLAAVQEHIRAGRLDQAKTSLMRLQQSAGPAAPLVARLLSSVLVRQGEGQQALYYADRAAKSAPSDPEARLARAHALWQLARPAEAVDAARAALALNETYRNSHAALINFLLRQERFPEVLECCRAALARFPGDPEFSTMSASMLVSIGRPEQAASHLREALEKDPKNIRLYTALGPALNYVPDADPAESLAVHRAYGRLLAELLPPRPPGKGSGPRDPSRPLKVGFLSPDLRSHAVSYFLGPVLRHLDRAQFAIHCYYTSAHEDDRTAALKPLASVWRHVPNLHVGQLAEQIAADAIDILIDAAGMTRLERLAAIQLRPAPVQMNYIGYPCTTGVPNMDYYITDTLSSPPGTEPHWTEKLLRIDPAYFVYEPPATLPDLAPPPRDAAGDLTFGSFNTLMKLNEQVVRAWTRIVLGVPGSRLLIKNVQLMQPEARRVTRERFEAAGIPADRLEVIGHTGTMQDHLATYNRVDVALDTFPYAGMTTTLEALAMGVPVVSIAQDRHASRVGLTILSAVGLADLVADSVDDLVSKSVSLAADVNRLASLRQSLRGTLLASQLCDGPGYAARFGAALRTAWATFCRSTI